MNGRIEGADPRLALHAEAVRAYLVSVRGGSPMLSGADARLLRDWLVRGVRIGAIVRAIDVVAARRRANRVRAALTLVGCRAEVEKQQKLGARGPLTVRRVEERPLPVSDAVDALATAALRDIHALPAEDADARIAAALVRAARFFEDAWAAVDRVPLLAIAETQLASLRDLYSADEWTEALEGAARDLLRQRYPPLTATHLWQEHAGGVD